MPTGDEYVNLALKRFLSQQRMSANFLTYLKEHSEDTEARIFPAQGLFTYHVTINYGAGVFGLSVTPSGDIEGTDGLGHTVILETARQSAIDFEDDGAATYWIGMKYILIPNGVYDNPRTGVPEYDKWMEEVGELDNPNSVSAGVGVITFNVNDIFESGVDHSGRTVRVWLVNPLSSDEAVAFEDVVVSYAGPDNTITTTGILGQGVISTSTADYKVAALGVTVLKSVVNPFSVEYVVFGNIDSSQAAPLGTDIGDQRDLSGGGGHTLQKAYDGLGGSGSGRIVNIGDLAIRLVGSQSTFHDDDIIHALLQGDKATDTAAPGWPPTNPRETEAVLDAKMRFSSLGSLIHRVHIWDFAGNDELWPEENVSVAGGPTDTLTFDRGAPLDLLMASGIAEEIWPSIDMVELSESIVGNNGVYIIQSVVGTPTNTFDLLELDGITAATLATEVAGTLKARIYRPIFRVGGIGGQSFQVNTLGDFEREIGIIAIPNIIRSPQNISSDFVALAITNYDDSKFIIFKPLNGDIELTGDYKYNPARQFYSHIDGSEGLSKYESATKEPFWFRVIASAGVSPNFSISSFNDGIIEYPIRLPWQADIQQIQVMCDDVGTVMNIETAYVQHDYSAPSLGNPTQLAVQATSGAGGVEVQSVGFGGALIDQQNRSYSVRIRATAVGQIIYGVKITYQSTIVAPA